MVSSEGERATTLPPYLLHHQTKPRHHPPRCNNVTCQVAKQGGGRPPPNISGLRANGRGTNGAVAQSTARPHQRAKEPPYGAWWMGPRGQSAWQDPRPPPYEHRGLEKKTRGADTKHNLPHFRGCERQRPRSAKNLTQQLMMKMAKTKREKLYFVETFKETIEKI
jgi:hypothetical protein